MSIYDQQLAGLQSKYTGYISKLPTLGVSKEAIADAQNALNIQKQMQALTSQYLAAQQTAGDLAQKQAKTYMSSQTAEQKKAQATYDAAQAAASQAASDKPGYTYGTQTDYYTDPGTGNLTAYPTHPRIETGNALSYQSDLAKQQTYSSLAGGSQAKQQALARQAAQQTLAANQATKDAQAAQTSFGKLAPEFTNTQNELQQLMQKYQQMQTTGAKVGGTAKASTANTPAAAKGGAAAAQQISGMPQKDVATVATAKANQTGQASSPFTLPNFAGLTFGGN